MIRRSLVVAVLAGAALVTPAVAAADPLVEGPIPGTVPGDPG